MKAKNHDFYEIERGYKQITIKKTKTKTNTKKSSNYPGFNMLGRTDSLGDRREKVERKMKSKYFNELKKSMDFISKKKNTIFIGQAVEVAGTAMSNTLINVKKNKKI